jgi:hypothetical protein
VSTPTTKDISVGDQPVDTKLPGDGVSEPSASPEPIKVTIDKFDSRLMVVWSAQGGIWIVPGYVFSSPDSQVAGQWFPVLAVADGVITMPELEQGAVTY